MNCWLTISPLVVILLVSWSSVLVHAGLYDICDDHLCLSKRFLRFGRTLVDEPYYRISSRYGQLGRKLNLYRIGRSAQVSSPEFLRFGRSSEEDPSKRSFMRIGRAHLISQKGNQDVDDDLSKRSFMRIGRGQLSSQKDNQDVDDELSKRSFMRIGRNSKMGRIPGKHHTLPVFSKDDSTFGLFPPHESFEDHPKAKAFEDMLIQRAMNAEDSDEAFSRRRRSIGMEVESDRTMDQYKTKDGRVGYSDYSPLEVERWTSQFTPEKRFMRFGRNKNIDRNNNMIPSQEEHEKSMEMKNDHIMEDNEPFAPTEIDKRFMRFGKRETDA